ncbi:uncharacterized protein [Nicotiana tomentosiformis]|uniref:uncharacterized protein n=1 Tax=Nicotiana tomentosiformis TaxID=4098 RepID=UPI00388C49E7
MADHLSLLEEEGRPHDGLEINDSFPDEQLLVISMTKMPWFPDLANYLGINFMGLFVSSCGNTYILVAMDYMSKWVEAVSLPNNEARSVVAFLKKNIFTRLVELEHKALWALKKLNLEWDVAANLRVAQ